MRTRKQYEKLSAARRSYYHDLIDARDLPPELGGTFRQRFIAGFGRRPRGEDYRRARSYIGEALEVRRGRLVFKDNDRLYRGSDPMPFLSPDGVVGAVPEGLSKRRRSLIGQHWALGRAESRYFPSELASRLKKFRGEEFVAVDLDTGKPLGRLGFLTDVDRFRSAAKSPEARAERVISPRLFGGPS
jgi:hypothetical protein